MAAAAFLSFTGFSEGEAIGMRCASSRDLDLHYQHIAWQRAGYDGHRRHGGLTTMSCLRRRRVRRLVRRAMSSLARYGVS